MSILSDAMNKIMRGKDVVTVASPTVATTPSTRWTREWLGKVADVHNLSISGNDVKVDGILGALVRKNGQCPCGGNGSQFQCPCAIMRGQGICKCGLFNSIQPRPVTGKSTAKVTPNN